MAQREVVKKVANLVIYNDGCIRVDNVRASFPHLDEPYAGKDENGKVGKAKFSIKGLLPKETHAAAYKALSEYIDKMKADLETGKIAADRLFLRDGDQSSNEEEEGHWTVSASEDRRPAVRDRKGNLLSEKEVRDMVYGGCYVNILLRTWYQDGQKTGKGFGKRINAGLVGVQFVRDGEPFGEGRISDEGAWDPLEDEDDEI